MFCYLNGINSRFDGKFTQTPKEFSTLTNKDSLNYCDNLIDKKVKNTNNYSSDFRSVNNFLGKMTEAYSIQMLLVISKVTIFEENIFLKILQMITKI